MLLASCAGGAPDLLLDQREIDMSPVINGEIRTIEISLYDLEERDVVIEAVPTSRGCTQTTISPTTITPGESALLVMQYDSGAHESDENEPVVRQIFIASNDGDEPKMEFRFTADLIARDL